MADLPTVVVGGYAFAIGGKADAVEAADLWERADAARDGRTPDSVPSRADIEMLRTRIGAPGAVFVLLKKAGAIVGTVLGEAARMEGGLGHPIQGQAHVAFVAVDPSLWGQGLGGILLERLAIVLRDTGYLTADLSVFTDNARAAALYARDGWVRNGAPYRHPRNGRLLQRYLKTLPAGRPAGR
jgi:ribosomal protein S18 acetylase RimI-like enzyme